MGGCVTTLMSAVNLCLPLCVRWTTGASGGAAAGESVLQQRLLRCPNFLALPSLLLQASFLLLIMAVFDFIDALSPMSRLFVLDLYVFLLYLGPGIVYDPKLVCLAIFCSLTWRGEVVFCIVCLMAKRCASLLYSLYVVFMATFLAVMLFFWLELFGDLSAGNMQVRMASWTTLIVSSHSFFVCGRRTRYRITSHTV